jgi:hypothetical protein
MEFPRHLHKPGGFYVVPENQDQCDQLLARGWALVPPGHVEEPKHVTLWDALNEPLGAAAEETSEPSGNVSPSISDLSAKDAEPLIAKANAEELAAMRAEEIAGKNRKTVLALIDVREADLIGD